MLCQRTTSFFYNRTKDNYRQGIILGLGASVLQIVHTFGAWKAPQTTEE